MKTTATARRLRRNQTDAERKLWFVLRDRRLGGWKFRRQFPIDRFVVDFFCADAHLIIELDGGQHAVRTDADASRTRILEAMGYFVLRFWNNDVMRNIDGVVEEIMAALERHRSEPPHPHPLPCLETERTRGNASRERVHVTSPRRGEVERAERARVRGFGRWSSSPNSDPPHPNPLPSGERESS
ncbi:MAG: endonuclease domain-containing protein [Xanthobacteraceae bacterium]